MHKLRLLIDTDPGIDDALAILMAHAHASVAGLTIAAGNVGIAHTTRNALKLIEILGCDTTGTLTRGATVVDWEDRQGRPANVRIVLEVDQHRFEDLVAHALGARSGAPDA